MTIPAVTRFDDFRFALYDMADGSQVILNPESVIDPQFETVPGVGGDRLKSCTFNIPWYEDAREAFDFDHLQLLAIGRYSDPALTLWGVVLKPKEGYSARVARDSIQVQAVQVEELLKCRKVFEYVDAKNKPLVFVNAKPDDIAKEMVRRCFTGVDVDGNARDWEWGTLTVEADSSQCVDSIGLTVGSGPDAADTLWKRIDDLARTYDFDYQLVPSLSGGAWTFTFKTQAPYGGDDLTTGDDRVQIKDLYNLVPSATRFRDAAFRATRMYISGYRDSVEDAAAIAAWGLWEGLADGAQLPDAEVALEKARVKEGAEYGFEATGANGMVTWLEKFKAGDTVLRVNNRLGIEADSEKIAAVSGRFVNKVLALTIRWGDREPAATDRMQGGAYKSDEPGGTFLLDPLPVGNTADPGDDPTHLIYGDHVHPLSITADDDGVMVLTDGVGAIIGVNGIETYISEQGALIVDGEGVCLWELVDDVLQPKANHAMISNHEGTWYVAGISGNTTWAAGAHMTWEGRAYRMPTDAPAAGEALIVTPGTPNQLSWAAPAPAAHNLLSAYHGDTTAGTVTRGDVIIGSGATPKWTRLGKGSAGQILTMGADEPAWAAPAVHHAAVTLSAAADANLLSLSTQEIGLDNQSANRVFAGPTSGAAAAPAFRALVSGDIPDISASYVPVARTVTAGAGLTGGGALSGNITLAVGAGTGITVNADDVAIANTAVTPGTYGSATQTGQFTVDQQGRITGASNVAITGVTPAAHNLVDTTGHPVSGLTAGHVLTALSATTYGFAAPAVHHAAVTLSAALDANLLSLSTQELGLDNQSANRVFAGPTSGAAAAPAFRSLVAADFPVSGVSAATYGSATAVPQIAVDVYGRITSASNVTISGVAPSAHNLLSTSHGDTLAAAVADGSIIIGNVTPKWSALAISVPAANVRNVLGVDNGETRPSWKTALDATNPATLTAAAAAAPGTSLVFAHRDHVHPITTTTAGAASTIVATDASGYIIAVRFAFDANNYLEEVAANRVLLNGSSFVDLGTGGTTQIRLQSGIAFPPTPGGVDLGTATYYFDDLHIAAITCRGDVLFYGDSASNRSLAGHRHGNQTGTQTPSSNAVVVTGSSPPGTPLYYDAGGHITTTASGNTPLYTRTAGHFHYIPTPYGSPASYPS